MTAAEDLPVGTIVRYWPGAREGEGRISTTRTPVWKLGHGTPVVSVEGYSGGIYLSHVEPLSSVETLRAAATYLREDPDGWDVQLADWLDATATAVEGRTIVVHSVLWAHALATARAVLGQPADGGTER